MAALFRCLRNNHPIENRMSGFRDCIVTYIDLIGIGKAADRGDPRASQVMSDMHAFVTAAAVSLQQQAFVYLWNDSILLLSYLDTPALQANAILKEADALKKQIDARWKSFAIAVQGQTFPTPPTVVPPSPTGPRVHVLQASSYAMANCFIIEEELKTHRMQWYIDSRISRYLAPAREARVSAEVQLLPANERRIDMYDGPLW